MAPSPASGRARSASWRDAAAWCSQPKRNEAEYAKLNAVVPQMQAFLRRGLGVVGFGEQESQRLAHGFGAVLLSMHQREVTWAYGCHRRRRAVPQQRATRTSRRTRSRT